jgi:Right handed beta helix region
MKLSLVIFITIIAFSIQSTCYAQVTSSASRSYYLSANGDDLNNGSKYSPWKSIARINSTTTFHAGDTILFEGGSVFNGTIKFNDKNVKAGSAQLIVTSFGKNNAIINAGVNAGLEISQLSHFKITKLIIKGDGREKGNVSNGIEVTKSHDFIIDSLEVQGFQHSGILVKTASNLRITHVHAHDNGFAGIHVCGTKEQAEGIFENENVYVGDCIASNNPGDPTVLRHHSGNGILVSNCKNALIEYCLAYNNGWDQPAQNTGGPVGIWFWDATESIIQYSISHDNKTNRNAKDGGGFDLDGGVTKSKIQYCLSYDNEGAGYGLFEFGAVKQWKDNVVRYNISINDGSLHDGSIAIWAATGKSMTDCEIYNNTFYNDGEKAYSLSIVNNMAGFNFRNNIFVYRDGFLCFGHHLETGKEFFQNNCYYSLRGQEAIGGYKNIEEWAKATGNEVFNGNVVGRYMDPRLVHPSLLSVENPRRLNPEILASFSLKNDSKLIDLGLDLSKLLNIPIGDHDMVGNVIPQGNGIDIGAVEYKK